MYKSEYIRDQIDALRMIGRHLESLSQEWAYHVKSRIEEYLRSRKDVAGFQTQYL